MHWSKVFLIIIIIDSGVFVLKSLVPIYLIWYGAEELRRLNEQDESQPSDGITVAVITLIFIGASLLLLITILRFLANWSQYRIEKCEKNSVEDGVSYFCSSFFWFFFSVCHIACDIVLIVLDWTEGNWLRKVVISFLCWQIFIFCFMVTLKILFCKGCSRHGNTGASIRENKLDDG